LLTCGDYLTSFRRIVPFRSLRRLRRERSSPSDSEQPFPTHDARSPRAVNDVIAANVSGGNVTDGTSRILHQRQQQPFGGVMSDNTHCNLLFISAAVAGLLN